MNTNEDGIDIYGKILVEKVNNRELMQIKFFKPLIFMLQLLKHIT